MSYELYKNRGICLIKHMAGICTIGCHWTRFYICIKIN